MRHLKYKIGDVFQIRIQTSKGDIVRACRKVSAIGFIYFDQAVMGEVQFDQQNDVKIEDFNPDDEAKARRGAGA